MSESLIVERRGSVLEVTVDRPKANAIDSATSREMGSIFSEFRDDPELRVAIVTGAGDRFFCAGWDLKGIASEGEADYDLGVGGWAGLQELPDLNKPVIAAVNGMALGGGFELALCADFILCAEGARFSLPELRAGILADGATIKLPRRIPYNVAVDMLMTGRWMEAQEAQHLAAFDALLTERRVRPTVMTPLWRVAGREKATGTSASNACTRSLDRNRSVTSCDTRRST